MQKLWEKALRRYRKTRQPAHFDYYKQMRNLTSSTIKREKKLIWIINFNKLIQKKMAIIEKVGSIKSKECELPDKLKDVNALKNYFVSSSKDDRQPQAETVDFYSNNVKESVNNLFSLSCVSEDTVLKIISKTKAFSTDNININLKLLSSYSHLFNAYYK